MKRQGVLVFDAVVRIRGVNPYVHVSAARARQVQPDWRRPMPVLVRIDHKPRTPWRINMMPIGNGGFFLYLHGNLRRASGTAVGTRVCVEVAFDHDYRGGPAEPLPAWFRKPLAENRRASAAWKDLSPSRQKEIVRYLRNLKTPQAQERNVRRALEALAGAPVRYMARTWGARGQ